MLKKYTHEYEQLHNYGLKKGRIIDTSLINSRVRKENTTKRSGAMKQKQTHKKKKKNQN